ncbi:hypothetical protein K456DRAFT_1656790 [Colletotrichum gloeosporioides 23]|nr:hypothetical protein K456DRAFT_1656790 [Colletotrichum gloeosporioides 23]
MVEQCILPICLRIESNGIVQFEPLVLELELQYELWGQRLQAINRWDRSYSNIAKLKQYLENCANYHGHKCNVPISQTPVPVGFRLIDAALRCIHPGSTGDGLHGSELSMVNRDGLPRGRSSIDKEQHG